MKFLTDENIGFKVINPGIDDTAALSIANEGKRILITTDKDFGELVFVEKLIHQGMIRHQLAKGDQKQQKMA